MSVSDYANVLFKVVAILGAINRVSATTPAHNVFCYSAVAHIVTRSVNLAFRPKLGSSRVWAVISGSGRVQASK